MTGMDIIGILRWIAMGIFVVCFYIYEIKKKEAFTIPAHLAILIAVLLHAVVRDWHLILKVVIVAIAIIGIGSNLLKALQKRKDSMA